MKFLNKILNRGSVDNSIFDPVCFVSSWKLMSTELRSFVLQIPDVTENLTRAVNYAISLIPQTVSDNSSSMLGRRKRKRG